MLCLISKYYLDITLLPRSNINRLLDFTDVYICFWLSVKTVLLILGLAKCNSKFVLFQFLISIHYLLKDKKFCVFYKRKTKYFFCFYYAILFCCNKKYWNKFYKLFHYESSNRWQSFNKLHPIIHQILTLRDLWIFTKIVKIKQRLKYSCTSKSW